MAKKVYGRVLVMVFSVVVATMALTAFIIRACRDAATPACVHSLTVKGAGNGSGKRPVARISDEHGKFVRLRGFGRAVVKRFGSQKGDTDK